MSSEVRVRRAPTPAAFFERAWDFLVAAEAEHNLLLGMASGLMSGDHAFESPIYLATLESGDAVVGYVFRTPPFKVGVSRRAEGVAPAVVDDLADVFEDIPAVLGPTDAAEAVARAWADRRGGRVERGMQLRIHAAEAVRAGAGDAPGRMRRARVSDTEHLIRWGRAFLIDAGTDGSDPANDVPRMIDAGAFYLWEHDGRVVSMAATTGATPNGMRVAWVYTPPEERGRGYATACVAALTEHVLATGRRCLYLYTDLANPTSNAIYARIGYEGVCDVADWHIR